MTFGVRRSPKTGLVVLLVAVIVLAGATWWLGSRVKSPEQAAAEAAPPKASPITAPVEYRKLSRTLVTRGSVRARRERGVTIAPSTEHGRPLVTKVPVKTGGTVNEGDLVAEVAQRPVFVFRGKGPMFRDLTIGAEGQDVTQLQAALGRLGFRAGDSSGRFGRGTAAAVARFYRSRGYEPLHSEAVEKDSGDGDQTDEEDPKKRARTAMVGGSELVFVKDLPARVVRTSVRLGRQAEGELLRLAGDGLIVEAALTAAEAERIKVGTKVTVDVEVQDRTFTSKVGDIDRSKQSEKSGNEAEPGTEEGLGPETEFVAQIKVPGRLGFDLRGEQAKVTFHLGGTSGKVLVVPVAAVWARADRSSYVEIWSSDGRTRQVRVTPGMSVDGYTGLTDVEGELGAGDLVVVGRERQ